MATLVIPTDANTVFGPPQGQWTYDDWLRLPHEFFRYEVINRNLYSSDVPSTFHQWIVSKLLDHIASPAEDEGLAYVGFARVAVEMPGCTPVQPDFVLVLKERAEIIRDRRIMGVPDLIVEILSPGSATYDEQIKLEAYANASVPEYAIIDPGQRQVSVYRLDEPGKYAEPIILGEDDSLTFNCLPTISLIVRDLFDGAPDTTL